MSIIVGSPPATTLIILLAETVFLLESVTVYVPVYEPTILASSIHVKVMLGVIFPSSVSFAVAPESVYTDHLMRIYGLFPRIVIVGALPAITLIVRVIVTTLLLESDTL